MIIIIHHEDRLSYAILAALNVIITVSMLQSDVLIAGDTWLKNDVAVDDTDTISALLSADCRRQEQPIFIKLPQGSGWYHCFIPSKRY